MLGNIPFLTINNVIRNAIRIPCIIVRLLCTYLLVGIYLVGRACVLPRRLIHLSNHLSRYGSEVRNGSHAAPGGDDMLTHSVLLANCGYWVPEIKSEDLKHGYEYFIRIRVRNTMNADVANLRPFSSVKTYKALARTPYRVLHLTFSS